MLSFYRKDNRPGKILDFGCGDGSYVRFLRDNNIDAFGLDRNDKLIGHHYYIHQDLTENITDNMKADYVQSFEVGEHIPKEKMGIFIDNICKKAQKTVVISWALKGAGALGLGDGHINEQNNDIIIEEFAKRNFIYDEDATAFFRKDFYGLMFMYFRHGIMVFHKKN